jgi:hypothetical protein
LTFKFKKNGNYAQDDYAHDVDEEYDNDVIEHNDDNNYANGYNNNEDYSSNNNNITKSVYNTNRSNLSANFNSNRVTPAAVIAANGSNQNEPRIKVTIPRHVIQQNNGRPASSSSSSGMVVNSDNHYERQYTCQRCQFFTNNPRAILYHRKEFHGEKINVHECKYCQYASQYSGKVERHTLLRHKIDANNQNSATSLTLATSVAASNLPQHNNSSSTNIKLQNHNENDHHSITSLNNYNNLVPNFQCHLCPCKYKRSSDLTKHLRLKHNASQNPYTQHRNNLNSSSNLNRSLNTSVSQQQQMNHSLSNHNNYVEEFNGDVGEERVESVNSIDSNSYDNQPSNHASQNEDEDLSSNSLKCPYCAFKIDAVDASNHSEYIEHVKEHLCGKMFRCVLCNSVYKYRGDCVVHLKRKHQRVDMLAQNFVDKFAIEQMNVHEIYTLLKPKQTEDVQNSDEKLFGCAYCDYKANYKGDVYKHQTRRHPGVPKMINSLAGSASGGCSSQTGQNLNETNQNYEDDYYGEEGTDEQQYDDDVINLDEEENNFSQDDTQNDVQNEPEFDEEFYNDAENTYNNENYNEEDGGEELDEDFFNERSNEPSSHQINHSMPLLNQNQHQQQVHRFKCDYCPFSAVSHAKLQSHMSIHYNLKRFMCPICKRRANFKWDIQKHMKKIHNDFTSDVIHLSETEARQTIQHYMDSTQPGGYQNSIQIKQPLANKIENHHNHTTPSQQRVLQIHNAVTTSTTNMPLKEKRYRCSLCTRVNSRWQYDVKKHLKNVHKDEVGEVIMVEVDVDPHRYNNNNKMQFNSQKPIMNSISNQKGGGLNATFAGFPAVNHPMDGALANSPTAGGQLNMSNTDATGNKKFCCSRCPYRSNWKADMYRHLRKRHRVPAPTPNDLSVLSDKEASSTLEEYERMHGINIRKRTRTANDEQPIGLYQNTLINNLTNGAAASMMASPKRFKSDQSIDMDSQNSNDCEVENGEQQQHQEQEIEDEENLVDTKSGGVERLPVSIAELNIKPYKCLKCGFRSDRKSDTLRHIRIKHDLDALQAYKFLKIMSIKEASETINEYEASRNNSTNYSRKVNTAQRSTVFDTNRFNNKPMITPIFKNDLKQPLVNGNTLMNNIKLSPQNYQPRPVLDFFKCPYCLFKNISRMVMKKHLSTHFYGKQINPEAPVYQCNTCSFKSDWQYTVKRHILASHNNNMNAQCVKINLNKVVSNENRENETIERKRRKLSAKKRRARLQKRLNKLENNNNLIICEQEFAAVSMNNVDSGSTSLSSMSQNQNYENYDVDDVDDYLDCQENNSDDHQMMSQNDTQETITSLSHHDNENSNIKYGIHNMSSNGGGEDERVESINLTDHDGKTFMVSYMVAMAPVQTSASLTNGLSQSFNGYDHINSVTSGFNSSFNQSNMVKKKTYFCQSCPYKTNNYCNLKQHLLLHRYRDHCYKCRYCPYYVTMIRLVKQHEVIHPEYVAAKDNEFIPLTRNGGGSASSIETKPGVNNNIPILNNYSNYPKLHQQLIN